MKNKNKMITHRISYHILCIMHETKIKIMQDVKIYKTTIFLLLLF